MTANDDFKSVIESAMRDEGQDVASMLASLLGVSVPEPRLRDRELNQAMYHVSEHLVKGLSDVQNWARENETLSALHEKADLAVFCWMIDNQVRFEDQAEFDQTVGAGAIPAMVLIEMLRPGTFKVDPEYLPYATRVSQRFRRLVQRHRIAEAYRTLQDCNARDEDTGNICSTCKESEQELNEAIKELDLEDFSQGPHYSYSA